MRKTSKAKTSPGDFKVTTLENPLLSQRTVTSKGISVPYTNLQLNPYPNTQLDLFCSDNISFSMYGSQYMTNQLMHGSKYVTNTLTWEGCWLQSFSVLQHDENHETPWLQNPTVYKCGSFINWNMNYNKLSLVTICLKKTFASSFIDLMTALKIILIYI